MRIFSVILIMLSCAGLYALESTSLGLIIRYDQSGQTVGEPSVVQEILETPLAQVDPAKRGAVFQAIAEPAKATINFLGSTAKGQLDITVVPAGSWLLTISLDGYRPIAQYVTIKAGYQYRLKATLLQKVGQLHLQSSQPDTLWYIDDREVFHGDVVPEGKYSLKARKFGYKDVVGSVRMQDGMVTNCSVHLEPVAFRIEPVMPVRNQFRSKNPGAAGTINLGFRVSNYGKARLQILDSQGTVVAAKEFGELATWDHEYNWNGRSDNDPTVLLPEGTYSWEVTAEPKTGIPAEGTLKVGGTVQINQNLYAKYRSTLSAVSGLDFVADTYSLPELGVAVSAAVLGNLPLYKDTALVWGNGFRQGLRIGLGYNLELTAGYLWAAALQGSKSGFATVQGGAKWAWAPPVELAGFSGALTLRASGWLAPPEAGLLPDVDSTLNGYQIGVPLQFSTANGANGRLQLNLEPTLSMGFWDPGIDTQANGGFKLHTIVRSGIAWDLEVFCIGASLAVRTTSLTGNALQAAWPVKTAMHLHAVLLDGLLVMAGTLGMDWAPVTSSPWFGLEVGLLL